MSKFENFIYTNDEALSERDCNEIINYTNKNIDVIVKDHSDLGLSPKENHENPLIKLGVRSDFSYYWSYKFVDYDLMNVVKQLCNVGLTEYIKKYPAIINSVPQGVANPDIKYHIVKS